MVFDSFDFFQKEKGGLVVVKSAANDENPAAIATVLDSHSPTVLEDLMETQCREMNFGLQKSKSSIDLNDEDNHPHSEPLTQDQDFPQADDDLEEFLFPNSSDVVFNVIDPYAFWKFTSIQPKPLLAPEIIAENYIYNYVFNGCRFWFCWHYGKVVWLLWHILKKLYTSHIHPDYWDEGREYGNWVFGWSGKRN